MLKIVKIVILSCLLASCAEPELEKVCLKLYMIDGRQTKKAFMLPKNRRAMQINSNRGSYFIQYIDGKFGHWVTVKEGVVDFDYIICK